MKIKNEKEIFDLFVDAKTTFRDVLKTPFIHEKDGRVWASNGTMLIMVNPECVSGKYDTGDYKLSVSTRDYNCDKVLLVSDLQDALKRCPHEPETQAIQCPECDGTGEISVKYKAEYDGYVYEIECMCPICDSTGTIGEEETGNMIPEKGSLIKFRKGYFNWRHIDTLIKACEILKVDKIKLVRTGTISMSIIELSKDIHICFMPVCPDALSEKEKESAINVKFTKLNRKQERPDTNDKSKRTKR